MDPEGQSHGRQGESPYHEGVAYFGRFVLAIMAVSIGSLALGSLVESWWNVRFIGASILAPVIGGLSLPEMQLGRFASNGLLIGATFTAVVGLVNALIAWNMRADTAPFWPYVLLATATFVIAFLLGYLLSPHRSERLVVDTSRGNNT